MRTTVTLDPDTEQLVRERMASGGVSFKRAVNDAIRSGARGREEYAFVSPTYAGGFLVDVTRANQLAGEIDDEALIERLRAGK